MTREYYYLDANYLIAYLARRQSKDFRKRLNIDKDQENKANKVISSLTSSRIKVSIFVLAELIMKIKEKGINVGALILCADFEVAMLRRGDINNFIKALGELVRDELLEEMDSIIVAHAISSSECKGLLTFDRKLINSRSVTEVNREINGSKPIVITSDPFNN